MWSNSRFALSALILAPVFGSVGLWLLLATVRLTESLALLLAQIGFGLIMLFGGVLLFVFALRFFASASGSPAFKTGSIPSEYRRYVLGTLVVILSQALLLLPGIGEERQFPLNQFPSFFLSAWYFYTLSILLSAVVLVYIRRRGGFYLSLLVSSIAFGTNILDLLGFLPPSAPFLRAMILEVSILPPAGLQAYISWRVIR